MHGNKKIPGCTGRVVREEYVIDRGDAFILNQIV